MAMLRLYCDGEQVWRTGCSDKTLQVYDPRLISQLGKVSTLSFSLPAINAGYDLFSLIASRVTLYEDDEIIFHGRPLQTEKAFSLMRKISCEDSLGFLQDIKNLGRYGAMSYAGTNGIQQAFTTILDTAYCAYCDAGNEVHAGTILGTNAPPGGIGAMQFHPESNGRGALGLIQSVAELRPGKLAPRWVKENGSIVTYVDYTKNDELTVSDQVIRFGENLLDLTDQLDGSQIFTVLLFYDKDNDVTYTHQVASHVAAYGTIQKRIEVSGINDRWDDAARGRTTEAAQYYVENAYGLQTMKLKAVDLVDAGVDVDRIRVGQLHRAVSPAHGLDAVYQCSKVTRVLSDPGRSVYEFGQTRRTLTGQIPR